MRRDGDVWHKVILEGPRTSGGHDSIPRRTDAAPGASVFSEVFWVAEHPDGTVWAASSAGMCRFDGQVFRLLPFRQSEEPEKICSAAMDARGMFWLTAENGLFSCDGQNYTREREPPEE